MKECPYCKQDFLWLAKVIGVNDLVVICPECDTIWLQDEIISDGTGRNFKLLMAERERDADWKDVELMSRLE